jgi:Family of unknown function (DUF6807)
MTLSAILPYLISLGLIGDVDTPVKFERGKDRVSVRIGGKPFGSSIWNDLTVKRPYFADIRSPKGFQVTRTFPPVEGRDGTDHATMHPGLWLAFGDISGIDFWRNKGVVRHAGIVEEPVDDPQGGLFAVRNLYEFNGKTICEEVCRIRIWVTPHGNLIEWESKFSGAEAFTFGDQEEMGLGVRVATAIIN